jgi:PAS domain S-box-containing protein
LGIILAIAVLSALSFLGLHSWLGQVTYVIPAVPVVVTAGLLGLRASLIAFGISIPGLVILSALVGENYWNVLLTSPGVTFTLLLIVMTVVLGRMHDLSRRLADELRRRDAVEQSLVEAQRLNKRITESIPDTIWIWELDTKRVVYLNQPPAYAAEISMERFKREGLAPLQALVHPDDLDAYMTGDKVRGMPDEGVHHFEYRVRQPDGSYRWIQAREVIFSRREDGRARYILNIEEDITEERHIRETRLENEKLQFALGKEREMTRLRSRLMETISHEFRTPLSIIMASGELLEMYLDRMSPQRRAECLTGIKTQTVHLRDMLNDLNTIMEQEAHPPRFRPYETDVRALCELLAERLRLSVGAQHTLALTFEDDLSQVQTDPDLLRPILQQLLSNAFKFSPAGSTVTLTVYREDEQVVYRVQDQGMGIPPEDASHIFDTFYRAPNTVATSGLGLGLKIVRDYVRLHQGIVEVASEPGKGTTFTLRLPAAYPASQSS